jgi:hypothetical protein
VGKRNEEIYNICSWVLSNFAAPMGSNYFRDPGAIVIN